MKLSALLVLLMSTMATHTMAQGRVWSIGPELGINFSKYGQDAASNDFKPGLIAGGFLTYSIENTHAFTGKILFTQKGTKFSNDNQQTLNYVEVPLIARIFFNREGVFRPNLFVGPSVAFLTGAATKVGENKPVSITNYRDQFNPVDFGITGGLGLNFLIATETRILFDFRYTHGLTDITKSNNAVINNQALAITAGVSFGL